MARSQNGKQKTRATLESAPELHSRPLPSCRRVCRARLFNVHCSSCCSLSGPRAAHLPMQRLETLRAIAPIGLCERRMPMHRAMVAGDWTRNVSRISTIQSAVRTAIADACARTYRRSLRLINPRAWTPSRRSNSEIPQRRSHRTDWRPRFALPRRRFTSTELQLNARCRARVLLAFFRRRAARSGVACESRGELCVLIR